MTDLDPMLSTQLLLGVGGQGTPCILVDMTNTGTLTTATIDMTQHGHLNEAIRLTMATEAYRRNAILRTMILIKHIATFMSITLSTVQTW
jgi:hypothetical protein